MKAVDEFASHDEIIDRIKDVVSRSNGGGLKYSMLILKVYSVCQSISWGA